MFWLMLFNDDEDGEEGGEGRAGLRSKYGVTLFHQ